MEMKNIAHSSTASLNITQQCHPPAGGAAWDAQLYGTVKASSKLLAKNTSGTENIRTAAVVEMGGAAGPGEKSRFGGESSGNYCYERLVCGYD